MANGFKTGGRRKGTPNKRTADLAARIAEATTIIESIVPDAFKGDAHALLMSVYKNPSLPIKDRITAAIAAIGYEKPKLAAIEHTGHTALTHEQALDELEQADRKAGLEIVAMH